MLCCALQWLSDSDQGLVLAGITTGGDLATIKDVISSRRKAGRTDKDAASNAVRVCFAGAAGVKTSKTKFVL